MKKYKLLKRYPNLPRTMVEGLTVVWNEEMGLYHHATTLDTFKASEIQFYPEFWEELIPKEWEIKKFYYKNGDSFYVETKPNIWQREKSPILEFTLEELLDSSPITIYSVKRLSDGEVFSVGDTIIHEFGSSDIVKSFHIDEGNLFIAGEHYRSEKQFALSMVKHHKPLFTTEDGVDIFKGDKVWGIVHGKNEPFSTTQLERASRESWNKFSSKEATIDHIVKERPILNMNEINEIVKPFIGFHGIEFYAAMKKEIRKKLGL